jgi:hypothetical protein
MLDLAVQLVTKEAAGRPLSQAEQALSDIMWIDIQVAPNGFDGWLYNSSSEQIRRTLEALETVGCSRVAEIVSEAIAVVGLDVHATSDNKRENRLGSISEADIDRFSKLDGEFYDAVEECMNICRAFVAAHQAQFQA